MHKIIPQQFSVQNPMPQTINKYSSSFMNISYKKAYVNGNDVYYCEVVLPFHDQKSFAEKVQNIFDAQKDLECPYIVNSYKIQSDHHAATIYQQPYQLVLSHIDRSTLTYSKKLEIVDDLAHCIQLLHKQKIVNLGIKPSVIALVQHEGRRMAKMIYLYQMKQMNKKQKQTSASCKKNCEYSSPEIRQNQKCGYQSDIWSLGCLFYELLFGKTPQLQIVDKETKIDFPCATPSWLIQILSGMLEAEPSRRYKISDVQNRLKFMKQCAEVAGRYIPTSF